MKNIESAKTFIATINDDAGYDYVNDSDIDNMVETRDTVDDFKANQEHSEPLKTSHGIIEVFIIKGSKELQVMDFGDFRLTLID